jgi:hypothetical protein
VSKTVPLGISFALLFLYPQVGDVSFAL